MWFDESDLVPDSLAHQGKKKKRMGKEKPSGIVSNAYLVSQVSNNL